MTSADAPRPNLAELFRRLPPRAVEAECDVLGGLMHAGAASGDYARQAAQDSATCLSILSPSDFSSVPRKCIFAAIARLHREGDPHDLTGVISLLRDSGTLDAVGGEYAVRDLRDGVPSAVAIVYHARLVGDATRRQEAIDVLGKSMVRLYEPGDAAGAAEAMAAASTKLADLAAGNGHAKQTLEIADMSKIERRDVRWLWPGRIALGQMSLLSGLPGGGKTFVLLDLAARLSRGTTWPDGHPCPTGSTLLCTNEDSAEEVIGPRLDALDADCTKIGLVRGVRRGRDQCRLITLAEVALLDAALQARPDCRLLAIDPIGSYLPPGVEANSDNEVRSVLGPVAVMAERRGVAVVIVAHHRKSTEGLADDLVIGSRGFTGIVRASWHLFKDPETKGRRILAPGKSNSGAPLAMAFQFQPTPDGKIVVPAWEPDPIDQTADDVLDSIRRATRTESGGDALVKAGEWLISALRHGPRPSKELVDEWKEGQGGSEATLKRARENNGVEAFRDTVPGPWSWRLKRNSP